MAVDPILRFSNGTDIVDILTPNSGWKMASPYWNPQIAQYKSGGIKINSALAEGQRLVHKEYDNVVETIPLVLNGTDQDRALKTLSDLLSLSRQSADYWAETYEFDDVWMQVQIACSSCYSGYARIVEIRIPELTNPFGQPFFSAFNEAVMEGISLIVEREPLWRAVPPGEVIGPLYNLIKNPDFEMWNSGVVDSQPDAWTDLETIQITGTNNQESTSPHSGVFCLRVRVSGSTLTGRVKGVTQTIVNTLPYTTYTVVAWVRSEGVSNGVGRVLVTYSGQLEVYRDNTQHGWTLYTGTFTTGLNDTVAINCEILSTATNTDGTVYFDSLMLLEGDWEQEAIDGVLPYLSSSQLTNHTDFPTGIVEAGAINYLDVWNVPGNEDALTKLEIVNATTPASVNSPVVAAAIRAGMRRTKNVLNFQNYADFIGATDTTGSSNDSINTGNLTNDWTTVATYIINDADDVPDNLGRFRVLLRVFDTKTSGTTTLQVRLRYWIGQANTQVKTLEAVTCTVLNNWTVLNLTANAGMNWDVKGVTLPSSLGFDIQMMRTSGTEAAKIDYALILPTDGGVLFSEVTPALNKGDGLVVDNTASSFVYGGRLRREWKKLYEAGANINAWIVYFTNYQGKLYFVDSGFNIYRYYNNTGQLMYASPTGTACLAVFNEKLYYARTTGGFETNGDNFPGTSKFTFTGTSPYVMLPFRGKLYLTGTATGPNRGMLHEWDGSSATTTNRLASTTHNLGLFAMAAYRDKIYIHGVATGPLNRVIEYDPVSNALTSLVLTTASTATASAPPAGFAVFKDKLYFVIGGGGVNNTIYRFDGNAWATLTVTVPGITDALSFGNVVASEDRIYICGRVATTITRAIVISSEDGTTWRIEYQPGSDIARNSISIAISQGQVFMSGYDVGVRVPSLHAVTITPSQYKVSDYQLSEFLSPPQKRHRFVFNWDRESDINTMDDDMLVGIGFVPRYLTLRGRF